MGFVSSHLKLHTDAEFNVQWSEIARVRNRLCLVGGAAMMAMMKRNVTETVPLGAIAAREAGTAAEGQSLKAHVTAS